MGVNKAQLIHTYILKYYILTTHIHMHKNNEKRDQDFERKQGRVYGKIQREGKGSKILKETLKERKKSFKEEKKSEHAFCVK